MKSKLTTGQIKTTPKPFTHSNKPENIAKKSSGPKVTKKKKIAHQPNVKIDTNPEDQMRKTMRTKQGL